MIRLSEELILSDPIYIRTSSRRVFRRCLRKWGFLSPLKMNLEPIKNESYNLNFWFGSAIHFALEDYFGWNRFGDPRKAFMAYYDAFKEIPTGAEDLFETGVGMLEYFLEWYAKHNQKYQFETLWLEKEGQRVPMVEQEFTLDLGIAAVLDAHTREVYGCYNDLKESIRKEKLLDRSLYILRNGQITREVILVPVYYHGTLDRVVVDKNGDWWIMDYKTAKSADTNKLDTDDQISAYLWAAEQWFQHSFKGFIYVQLTKETPKPPRRLINGNLSTDKSQKTTYSLYRKEVIKDYGDVRKAPAKVIETLNHFAEQEMPEGDRFVRWDMVQRTIPQKIATYNHIIAEVKHMLSPNLYLYPNPTRDCIWDCEFRDACIAMDAGDQSTYEFIISSNFQPRNGYDDTNHDEWRSKIKWPDEPVEKIEVKPDEFLESIRFDIILEDEEVNEDD